MSSGIIQAGRVMYGVIHFSPKFPVERTACGTLGPSAGRWRYCDCIPCLENAPKDPRIEARLAHVRAELAAREASPT